MTQSLRFSLAVLLLVTAVAGAALPLVPVPPENPITEHKRVLGKILFWDEQLSSDDSIACGSCHRPAAGGGDPRLMTHPGHLPGTIDDVAGSPGIRRLDAAGRPQRDPIFADGPQVTPRIAPAVFGALWATEVFWDGRAGTVFTDPATGEVLIERGGALENQVLMTLASPVEMAHAERSWRELTDKLGRAEPLALADRWPADVARAIAQRPDYPALFEAAFGDAGITAARIALAIASYERTLVPDQTAWDRYQAGDTTALGRMQQLGLAALTRLRCTQCHVPPLFTNNDFANIGLRRSEYDAGRAIVTGAAGDAGAVKVPSLRNAALRPRLMHTGQFDSLGAAIDFYRNRPALPDVDRLPDGTSYAFDLDPVTMTDILSFLQHGLTDPRVAAETFPFDRPRLASER